MSAAQAVPHWIMAFLRLGVCTDAALPKGPKWGLGRARAYACWK